MKGSGIKPFVTKDSGQRQDFSTGSRRDTNEGKPRYDLVPVEALRRWADLMARGAKKYGERNWTKGQPILRFEESALRHFYEYIDGSAPGEDHLAGVLFNIGAIMHHEALIETGQLPRKLDDRGKRGVAPNWAKPKAAGPVTTLKPGAWERLGNAGINGGLVAPPAMAEQDITAEEIPYNLDPDDAE